MFCSNCGSSIDEKARFCVSCGTKITNFPAEDEEQPAVEATSQEFAPSVGWEDIRFWSRPTLLYSAAAIVLFIYTCIHYWS
jgi:uncharacterized membrane protein YvbJ